MILDTMRLLNLSSQRKNIYIWNQKRQFQQRILTGKTQKLTSEQKAEKRKEYDDKRNKQEANIMGGYELIFPLRETIENTYAIE